MKSTVTNIVPSERVSTPMPISSKLPKMLARCSGEAMNAACLTHAPVLFLVEDNGFAISVPVEQQTAGGSISEVVSGFPGLFRIEVDGGVDMQNAAVLAQAGANTLVAGTSIFHTPDAAAAARQMRRLAAESLSQRV